MKKKPALSAIAFLSILLLMAENIIILLYFLITLMRKNFQVENYSGVLFFLTANAVIAFVCYFFIFLPYKRIKKNFKMFIDGKIYEDMFDEKFVLTPELNDVMNRFHHLLNKQDAINISNKQAEYLALQNQINPHFLYNTLEAIRGDALYAGMEEIAQTTEALASFFRYTITDAGSLVSLENELENVENYFIIQQYRFGNKIKLVVESPDQEETVFRLKLPKLTLQPVVENAIFHGLEGKAEGGTIRIHMETTVSHFFISIMDNGLGMPPEILDKINNSLDHAAISYVHADQKKKAGIALKNVSRRIKLLFGEEYGIHIFSTPDFGTDVRITLPYILDKTGDGNS